MWNIREGLHGRNMRYLPQGHPALRCAPHRALFRCNACGLLSAPSRQSAPVTLRLIPTCPPLPRAACAGKGPACVVVPFLILADQQTAALQEPARHALTGVLHSASLL